MSISALLGFCPSCLALKLSRDRKVMHFVGRQVFFLLDPRGDCFLGSPRPVWGCLKTWVLRKGMQVINWTSTMLTLSGTPYSPAKLDFYCSWNKVWSFSLQNTCTAVLPLETHSPCLWASFPIIQVSNQVSVFQSHLPWVLHSSRCIINETSHDVWKLPRSVVFTSLTNMAFKNVMYTIYYYCYLWLYFIMSFLVNSSSEETKTALLFPYSISSV